MPVVVRTTKYTREMVLPGGVLVRFQDATVDGPIVTIVRQQDDGSYRVAMGDGKTLVVPQHKVKGVVQPENEQRFIVTSGAECGALGKVLFRQGDDHAVVKMDTWANSTGKTIFPIDLRRCAALQEQEQEQEQQPQHAPSAAAQGGSSSTSVSVADDGGAPPLVEAQSHDQHEQLRAVEERGGDGPQGIVGREAGRGRGRGSRGLVAVGGGPGPGAGRGRGRGRGWVAAEGGGLGWGTAGRGSSRGSADVGSTSVQEGKRRRDEDDDSDSSSSLDRDIDDNNSTYDALYAWHKLAAVNTKHIAAKKAQTDADAAYATLLHMPAPVADQEAAALAAARCHKEVEQLWKELTREETNVRLMIPIAPTHTAVPACMVCYAEVETDPNDRQFLACFHLFCQGCIRQVIAYTEHGLPECPTCRTDIDTSVQMEFGVNMENLVTGAPTGSPSYSPPPSP